MNLLGSAVRRADGFVDLEDLTDDELDELESMNSKNFIPWVRRPSIHKLHRKIIATRQNRSPK